MSKNEMKHFYYSAKQDREDRRARRFGSNTEYHYTEAFIDGKFAPYSEMSSETKPSGLWDDYEYLGTAQEWYLRIDGKVQHDALRYLKLMDAK